jgi:hypothetical protein
MHMPPPDQHGFVRMAWVVSLLGLLPFLWPTSAALFHTPMFGIAPVNAILAYGSIILSFLGGALWMCAVNITGNRNLSEWGLWMSIMPALAGWAALLIGEKDGVLVLIAGYVGLLGIEVTFYRMALMPAWFWALRWKMTAIVIALLSIMAL